jgi:hypothetical protein
VRQMLPQMLMTQNSALLPSWMSTPRIPVESEVAWLPDL